MQISINTNRPKSIDKAIKRIEEYRDALAEKEHVIRSKLAEVGLTVISSNLGAYGEYIEVGVRDEDGNTFLFARGTRLTKRWQYWGSIWETDDFSPLLMLEFGSGDRAVAPKTLDDGTEVGRGTFPAQKHADESSWHWLDLEGNWHTGHGFSPTQPMLKAYEEMYKNVKRITKECLKAK